MFDPKRRPSRPPPAYTGQGAPTLSQPPVYITEQHDPGIQISVVRERAEDIRAAAHRWRAFEVWTRNRVYGLDQQMVCFDVIDRRSSSADPRNRLLGYRLGGGRHRDGTSASYAYPFPLQGMEAMFQHEGRQIYTSRVERFVLRIRELSAHSERARQSWEELLASGR